MSLADELAYTTAAELAARIRRRELSPLEVIDATIARIEERNPDLNAFVFRGYDDARTQAKAAEQAVIEAAAAAEAQPAQAEAAQEQAEEQAGD